MNELAECSFKGLKLFPRQQIPKCDHNRKQIMLTDHILCTFPADFQLLMENRIRDIISCLIGEKPFSMGTYISVFCNNTEKLLQLPAIDLFKIFSSPALNVCSGVAVKF